MENSSALSPALQGCQALSGWFLHLSRLVTLKHFSTLPHEAHPTKGNMNNNHNTALVRTPKLKIKGFGVGTCAMGGFQRMFLRGAGVNPQVPVGLFFSSRTTPLGSSLSFPTRFFSCQPT